VPNPGHLNSNSPKTLNTKEEVVQIPEIPEASPLLADDDDVMLLTA